MKNKIVTLICVLVIGIVTAVVAFSDASEPQYINSSTGIQEQELVQQLLNNSDDWSCADEIQLLPGVCKTREVKVKNITTGENATPVFVRTVLAFEAGNLNLTDFLETMNIEINTDEWLLQENTDESCWMPIQIDGNNYYMITVVYRTELASGATSSPSLIRICMNDDVTSKVATQFGDEYKFFSVTQAVQADGWTNLTLDSNGETPIESIKGVLDQAFGEITSTNHPWKDTSTMPETNTSAADDNNN